jgi:competence ComEA-like helix-hairpin-helix protein
VADRSAHGAFGDTQALDRIPGVGQALLAAIADHVTFSGPPRAATGSTELGGSTGSVMPLGALVTDSVAPERLRKQKRDRPMAPISLNSASLAGLDSLPGIGPAKAAAIVQYRDRHGPFGSVEDLAHVPGIKPALLKRLRSLLLVH